MTETDSTELQQSWVKTQLCLARGTERCKLSDKEQRSRGKLANFFLVDVKVIWVKMT